MIGVRVFLNVSEKFDLKNSNLLAGISDFKKGAFLEASKETKEAVKVKFYPLI